MGPPRASIRHVLAAAAALAAAAVAAPPGPGPAGAPRRRQVDRLPSSVLYPADAHPQTRARHRRVIAGWRAPTVDADAPLITPVTFGADPTGRADSTAAFKEAIAAALSRNSGHNNMSDCSKTEDIVDLGGVVIDLQGGDYLVSEPLLIPKCYGNMRVIDGALRATPSFPTDRYIVEVGDASCSTPQASCNQNIAFSGVTLDGSHVAAGCLSITATMGATLDSSSAIFGFNVTGVALNGGHEFMMSET